MDGNLGLGMAIPEDATAALGPLPHLIPTITQEQKDAEVRSSGLAQFCTAHKALPAPLLSSVAPDVNASPFSLCKPRAKFADVLLQIRTLPQPHVLQAAVRTWLRPFGREAQRRL